jgi:hypothetical protein
MLRHRVTARQAVRRFTLGSGPLKRTSDRLECLARVMLTGALLFAVAVALAVGTATSTRGRSEVLAQASQRHQVSAELQEDATRLNDAAGTAPGVGQATAVWTTPSGVQHTGSILVPAGATAGSRYMIWIDEDGNRTGRPLSYRDVAGQVFAFALLTYLGTALAAWGAYRSLRALLDRSRARRWTAEWAVVEPEWTGKVP